MLHCGAPSRSTHAPVRSRLAAAQPLEVLTVKLLRPLIAAVTTVRWPLSSPRRKPVRRQLPAWAHQMARKQAAAVRAR